MFENRKIFGGFAVRDTEKARAFYGETLGLDVRDGEQPGILEIHGTGGTPMLVYPKPDHVPATFTVLNIDVADIDQAVAGLGRSGVRMEHYDGDQMTTDQNGILRGGGMAIAWFKDPFGNIVSVIENEHASAQQTDDRMASTRR
jgi:catechol 2,3-dioxygenase-like lactoylglutathione lyase family enzyme